MTKTSALIVLVALGLLGMLFRVLHWPLSEPLMAIGFLGFPVLYGYISWPRGSRFGDRKWWGMMVMMVLFGLMILFN